MFVSCTFSAWSSDAEDEEAVEDDTTESMSISLSLRGSGIGDVSSSTCGGPEPTRALWTLCSFCRTLNGV